MCYAQLNVAVVWRKGDLRGSLVVRWMAIGCLMSPCGRRQRGGDGVEAGCYLGEDGTGKVDGANRRQWICDIRDGNKMLLPLVGARGLAVGYREFHCCCSDEENGAAAAPC